MKILNRSMQGLTLVELLISMLLGLTLSAGVVQIYTGLSSAERSREASGHLQANGRFGLNFLSQEIRMAGNFGCVSSKESGAINNILQVAPASFQPLQGLQGWEANGSDTGNINNSLSNVAIVDTSIGGWGTTGGNILPSINALPGSDILRVWGGSGSASIINSVTPGAALAINAGPIDIAANDFLIVSDCDQIDIVQACEVTTVGGGVSIDITLSQLCAPGNVSNALIGSRAGGEVVKLQASLIYVGKRDDNASNPASLFRRRLASDGNPGPAEELVEGVESMQLLYGLNIDNDVRNTVDTYLPADQVPVWANVISVRINLLMHSVEDGVHVFPQSYAFNGVDYDSGVGNGALPDDKKLRRVFSGTINLRNRTLGI